MDPFFNLENIQETWNSVPGTDSEKSKQFFLIVNENGEITLKKKPTRIWEGSRYYMQCFFSQNENHLENIAQILQDVNKPLILPQETKTIILRVLDALAKNTSEEITTTASTIKKLIEKGTVNTLVAPPGRVNLQSQMPLHDTILQKMNL